MNLSNLLRGLQQQQNPYSDWAQSHKLTQFEDYLNRNTSFTPEMVNYLLQLSSVAPQYDAGGNLLNGSQMWSDFVARVQDREDGQDFFDNFQLQWNPLKYGDVLGLTKGPLSGDVPGKLTDQGINLQQIANPGINRDLLEKANDVAPAVAAAIATFGGSAAAGAGLSGEAGASTLTGGAAADTLGGEAALGSGLTAGTTASGIGAGEVGTGLSAGATGASGIGTAGAAGTSLAPGFFGSEAAYPVIGGASGVGSLIGSGGTTAAAAGGATALGRLINGSATAADYASIAGNLGIAGLGYYGATRQGDSLAGIAAENRADRLPFYNKSLEYLNNPGAYASGPGRAALEANLRALSVNGNPADNPALLSLATTSALKDWRDAVTGFGNMGLSGSDTRANLMSGAAGADANALNAIGYGIGSTINPPSTIEQLLKQLKGSGVGLA